nr:hypothetical protein [Tanacetum cinerariifolium]
MHQAVTRHRGKAVVNSPRPIYDQEPSMVDDDKDTSKDKEIDKLMALIFLSLSLSRKSTNLPTTTFALHQIPVVQIRIILHGFTKMLGMKVKEMVPLLGLEILYAHQWCRNLEFNATTARNMGMLLGNVRSR